MSRTTSFFSVEPRDIRIFKVVGVRKMEHLRTTPVKSLESRKALLNLAKTLETPDEEIVAYIEREEAAIG